jgi:hypothetical protein
MRESRWPRDVKEVNELALARSQRLKEQLEQLKKRREERAAEPLGQTNTLAPERPAETGTLQYDDDFQVLTEQPNTDLVHYVDLFDRVNHGTSRLHLALLWPQMPPRPILPWIVREACRGLQRAPLRALFMNLGRSSLQSISGLNAQTQHLKSRGVHRSGVTDTRLVKDISSDAHFYMFLGSADIPSLPAASLFPHGIAINDDVYWRDFDEKTLKGFKRHFDSSRLSSIKRHLELLTSGMKSPAFAFLLPSHFEGAARRNALNRLPGPVDLAVIDASSQAVHGREISSLVTDQLTSLEKYSKVPPRNVLILTDCPLRYSFLKNAIRRRQNPGKFGTRLETHHLRWTTRGRGFHEPRPLSPAPAPIVETIASQESVVATKLWQLSAELEDDNPLFSVLREGAAALKNMALLAAGSDAILAPYTDTHDFYHRLKRERHSFVPHYNKALELVGEGRAGHLRDKVVGELARGLALAEEITTTTPLMRYLKRLLEESSGDEDILIVLRHPEDAQQSADALMDFLTEPGRFTGRPVPNLRVTTPFRYAAEYGVKSPNVVVWAASANVGGRAYVGDPECPKTFRLVVAGQDAAILGRTLDALQGAGEYADFKPRIAALRAALPWSPKDFGGIGLSLELDPDRRRGSLPFEGQGYLLLDGFGRVAASTGSTFYVLDPVTQQLHPKEARAIEIGESIFVMSDHVRDEIEAMLREKNERGRTFEQELVDHYKTIVKNGVEALERKEGKPVNASRIHDMLFAANPLLPPIEKAAVDYWLQAAERRDEDTPYAARKPEHLVAFLKLMGAGVLAEQLTAAIRIVRHALQRDGHTNRALFDRLLLDPDSLMRSRHVTQEKLRELKDAAMENLFPVLEKHLEAQAANDSGRGRTTVTQ